MTIIYCDLCEVSITKRERVNTIRIDEYNVVDCCNACAKKLISYVRSKPWKEQVTVAAGLLEAINAARKENA